ncbi:MAG: RNase adapter RapZ [Acetanaerobacterium sp.]
MELVIITGLSGAGKTRAANVLEDIGFFCADNMPPILIPKFAELCSQSDGKISKIAIVTDIRGGNMFSGLIDSLDEMKNDGYNYKVLFLDCRDDVLIRRFKETRRKHPLVDGKNASVENAIAVERVMLKQIKSMADYTIDTSILSPAQLKERLSALFWDNLSSGIMVNCMSFGFKYGLPSDADLVFDVRCLPNPFYYDELKQKTGLDKEVSDFVLSFEESREFLRRITEMLEFSLPLYTNEGKSQLVVAIGCTGGKHRSVTFAQKVCAVLEEKGIRVIANHRDITKDR